jgi:hypothetical protein
VFTITATQDAIYEVSEALTLSLALGAGETDATLGTATATGTIYDPNIPPTDGDETNIVTEDTTLTVSASAGLLLNANDPDGNTLTITGYTIDGISGTQVVGSPVTIPNVGVLTINADGSYSFDPVANYTGAIPVATYTISDGNGGTDTSTLTLTMLPVNDNFTDANESVTTPEDTVKTGNVIDIGLTSGDGLIRVSGFIIDGILDVNNRIPTFTAGQTVSISGVGSIKIESNGSYIFTPVANWNGTVPTVTYSLTDSFGIEEVSTLDIVVTPVNDAPTGTDKTINILEDSSYTYSAADFGFADLLDAPAANSLQSVIITTLPVEGILKLNGVTVTAGQVITAANIAQLVYTPDANENGTNYASFTFKVVDDGGIAIGGQDTDLVANTITINVFQNTPPVAVDDNYLVAANGTVALTPLTQDSDSDGGTLSVVSINGVTLTPGTAQTITVPDGLVSVSAAGEITFTPNTNFNGTVTIPYVITDGQGGSATANEIIEVKLEDEKPPLPRKDVFGHHYFQRRFEEKPIEMGRYEFNEIVLDFNGDQGGINQFRPPMADTTGTRDALDYSNVTPYNKFDRVADEIEIAKRSLDLGLAILKLPDYELRNILPLADVKVPANGNVEYRLPAATFKGGKGDLKLVAVLKDGSPLPGWLKFNPKTGLFEGVVPPDHVGPIDLKVIATDDVGGQADVKLTIKPEASKAVLKGKPSFTAQLKSAIGLGQ